MKNEIRTAYLQSLERSYDWSQEDLAAMQRRRAIEDARFNTQRLMVVDAEWWKWFHEEIDGPPPPAKPKPKPNPYHRKLIL